MTFNLVSSFVSLVDPIISSLALLYFMFQIGTKVEQGKTDKSRQAALEIVKKQQNECLGLCYAPLMKANGIGRRNLRCHKCNIHTSWYCLGCDRPLCPDKVRDDKEPSLFEVKQRHPLDPRLNETYLFTQSCYHKAHAAAWDAYYNADSKSKSAKVNNDIQNMLHKALKK